MCRFGAGVPEPTHEPGGRKKYIAPFEDHFFLAACPQRDDPVLTGRNLAILFCFSRWLRVQLWQLPQRENLRSAFPHC